MERLYGRDELLASLEAQLEAGEGPVLLVGPGGIGKSSIARSLLTDRGLWVDLAGARDRGQVLARVAEATGIPVPRRAGQAAAVLGEALAAHPGRVVLDDLDLLDAEALELVAGWVEAGGAGVLTSRTIPSSIHARVVDVPALGPEPARELFVARADARVVDPERDVAAVDRLVRLVDGLPLGIELAAGHTPLQGVAGLVEALEAGLTLTDLPGEHPPGHRSLAAVVARSVDRLEPGALRTLQVLVGFDGPFTLDEARAAGAEPPEILTLRKRSLVGRVLDGPEVLLTLRPEVRAYVHTEAPPPPEVRRAFAEGLARWVEPLWRRYHASRPHPARRRIARRSRDLRRLLDAPADLPPQALGAVASALTTHVEHARPAEAPGLYAVLTPLLGRIPWRWRRGIETNRASGLRRQGRPAEALAALDASQEQARAAGEAEAVLRLRIHRAVERLYAGQRQEALEEMPGVVEAARASGDAELLARALGSWGRLLRSLGRDGEAMARLREAVRHARSVDLETYAVVLETQIFMAEPDPAQVRLLARELLDRVADPHVECVVLINLATSLLDRGDVEGVDELWPRIHERARRYPDPEVTTNLHARWAVSRVGRVPVDEARRELLMAERELRRLETRRGEPWVALGRAVLAHLEGDLVAAEEGYAWAARAAREGWGWNLGPLLHRPWRLCRAERGQLPEAPEAVQVPPLDAVLLDFLEGRASRRAVREALSGGGADALDHRFMRVLTEGVLARRPGWVVAADGTWARSPTGEDVDLSRRRAASRILAALARHREEEPAGALSADALVEAGWPGEQILPDAAKARLYAAIRDLRTRGFAELLQTVDGGYRLDPDVDLERGAPAT